MNKQAFMDLLRNCLSGMPQEDIRQSVEFYSEAIDDRIEEGMTEEEAVAQLGTVEEVAAQIMSEAAPAKPAAEKPKPRRKLSVLEIILLVLGSPIWLSLLIAAFAVVISVYAVVWSVIISLWAGAVSVAACAVAGVFVCVLYLILGHTWQGIAMLGAGLVCAGIAIFFIYGCLQATKGIVFLTKKTWMAVGSFMIRRRETA